MTFSAFSECLQLQQFKQRQISIQKRRQPELLTARIKPLKITIAKF